MNKILRIGLCGCGSSLLMYEGIHWPTEKYQLVAVADINCEQSQKAGTHWGIKAIYDDPLQMFRNEVLDMVIIATPPATHAELAIQAAKHRLNILIQKPLACSIEEGQQIIDCCRANKVTLKVSFVRRYFPAFQKANLAIKEMGQALLLRINWCSISGKNKRKSKQWKEDLSWPL